MLTWDSRRRGNRTQILVWSDGHKKGGKVPLPWMMDVGAFQVRGVRPPPVSSCDYLIRRRGIRWIRNDRSRHMKAREGRGVDSMLANHKRDCIESATGLFSSFPESLHSETRSRPVLSLCPLLFSLSRWSLPNDIRLPGDRVAMNGGSATKKKERTHTHTH